jgi:hypothetical protein
MSSDAVLDDLGSARRTAPHTGRRSERSTYSQAPPSGRSMPHLEKYTDQHGQSFPAYFLQVVALSVALAWLMGNTRGSLLLAVLMHSAINQTKDIVPSKVSGADSSWALSTSGVAWLTVAVVWIAAAYFLHRMRARERVANTPQPQGEPR